MICLACLSFLFGCSATSRAAAEGATRGVFDALERPDDELVAKARLLAKKYLDAALAAAPPKGLDEIIRDVTGAVLSEVEAHAPEQRALVQSLVREAVSSSVEAMQSALAPAGPHVRETAQQMSSGMVAGLVQHDDEIVDLIRRSSAEAGRAMAREAANQFFSEMQKQLGPRDAEVALGDSLSQVAERTTQGAMAGVTDQLELMLREDCPGGDPEKCPPSLLRRMSRAMAMGAAEGVGYKIEWWHVLFAFLGGATIAAAIAWGLRRAATRRACV